MLSVYRGIWRGDEEHGSYLPIAAEHLDGYSAKVQALVILA
jgi:hypothetical protein